MTTDPKKQAYEEKAKAKLQEWDAEIEKLQAKAQQANADARAQYFETVEKLKQHRDDMQTELREIQKTSSTAFDDLKAGFDQAWESMNKAMKQAHARFN